MDTKCAHFEKLLVVVVVAVAGKGLSSCRTGVLALYREFDFIVVCYHATIVEASATLGLSNDLLLTLPFHCDSFREGRIFQVTYDPFIILGMIMKLLYLSHWG